MQTLPRRRDKQAKQTAGVWETKKTTTKKKLSEHFLDAKQSTETFLNGGKHLLKEAKCLKLLSVCIEIPHFSHFG